MQLVIGAWKTQQRFQIANFISTYLKIVSGSYYLFFFKSDGLSGSTIWPALQFLYKHLPLFIKPQFLLKHRKCCVSLVIKLFKKQSQSSVVFLQLKNSANHSYLCHPSATFHGVPPLQSFRTVDWCCWVVTRDILECTLIERHTLCNWLGNVASVYSCLQY